MNKTMKELDKYIEGLGAVWNGFVRECEKGFRKVKTAFFIDEKKG